MNEINTGGPAFPSKKRIYKAGYATAEFEPVGGMTLRDYFAAKAMAMFDWSLMTQPDGTHVFDPWTAERCYMMADAMLKARGETK